MHSLQHADVAQLVAHHLAKVRVASSSLVIRSKPPSGALPARLAQRESASLTRKRSLVQSQYRARRPFPRWPSNGRKPAVADVAQLVAHHLAKVRVASSSLVIRSKYFGLRPNTSEVTPRWIGRVVRQRSAKPCTRVRFPYPPPFLNHPTLRAFSSSGERFPDTEEVTGSIPVSRTRM